MSNFCFPVVATGGLDNQRHALLMIAWVVTDEKFEIKEESVCYIKPADDLQIEEEAMKVNQIDTRKILEGMKEEEALNLLNKSLNNYNCTLVGYNLPFELGFFKSACFRNKIYLGGDGVSIDLHTTSRNVLNSFKYAIKSACQELKIKMVEGPLKKAYASIEIAKKVL